MTRSRLSRHERVVAARRRRRAARRFRCRYLAGAALVIVVVALALALGLPGGEEVHE